MDGAVCARVSKLLSGFVFAALILLCCWPSPAWAAPLEAGFRDLLDGHGSIMLLIDPDTGSIRYANPAAVAFYGYPKERLESMRITDVNALSPEETAAEMQAAVTEQRNHFVFSHQLASGEIRTVEVFSYPYISEGERLLFSVIHDITEERLLAERHSEMTRSALIVGSAIIVIFALLSFGLFRSLKRLQAKTAELDNFNELRRAFIDADDRLIYLKDEHLKYVFVNQAMEQFMQRPAGEIVGQEDFALDEAEFAALKRATDVEVLENRSVKVNEVKWRGRVYQTTKFPIKMLNGAYGVGAYVEDVTDEKRRRAAEEKTVLRHAVLVDVFSRQFASTQEQLDFVLSKAMELTGSRYGYIYLYREDLQEFTLNTWSEGAMQDCAVMDKQTRYHLEQTGIWGEAVRQRQPVILNEFGAPHPLKRGYPSGHVQLTRFMTVPVMSEGRIVAVVGLANKDAEYDWDDVQQISLLMVGAWNAREKRDNELALQAASEQLAEHKNQLQLILDSTAEAIYGIDKDGNCTFCNASCLRILGYQRQEDLLGKNMHWQIHHSYRDGRRMQLEDCRIVQAVRTGKGAQVDDEVFWRADGSSLDVEYFSYPQVKDGQVIGAVVTFVDITERRQAQARIEYLSLYDSLTGLYNRAFFEAEMRRLDTERNLPISIIAGDLNGLKLTNDVFGHAAGDQLLMRVAEVSKRICRADDIIARVGGDEFCILLPRTRLSDAEAIAARIKREFAKERIVAINGSISLGCDAKTTADEQLLAVYESAENKMYEDKTLHRRDNNANMIETIIATMHANCPAEKVHSEAVSMISQKIGAALQWSEEEMRKLKDAAFLHDIGKVVFEQCQDMIAEDLSETERDDFRQHPAIGYRILNLFDETMDLADAVLSHHEHWDGSGYPRGLRGEEIPKLARVIAVASAYDRLTRRLGNTQQALQEMVAQSGSRFHPEMVELLVQLQRGRANGQSVIEHMPETK